jgi:P4 family phage/plasmid primase-like protien
MIPLMTEQHINEQGGRAILQAAQRYREQGFAVVPTEGKDAFIGGWQKNGTPPEDDHKYWGNGHAHNIGLVLGKASGDLVDVDRDCDLLKRVDRMFLPDTLMGGREKRPYTHSFYYSAGIKSRALYDANGKKYLEVRADGHQTVVAPSRHPEDGDRYRWHNETGTIATVGAEELDRAVNEYATSLLLAIHMPPVGSRHDYALAAAGFLLRDDRLEPETAERILLGAWHAAAADDNRKTVKEVQSVVFDTAEKLRAGQEVRGGRVLGVLIKDLPKRISKIWGWRGRNFGPDTTTDSDKPQPPTHDELRDRWFEANPDYAHGLGEWRRYQNGVWAVAKQPTVEASIMRTLEGAKREGIKPNGFVLSSVHKLARIEAYVVDERWDADPNIIIAANGAIDIISGVLLRHDPTYYCTTRVPYAFDPNAEAPNWNRFLGDIHKDVATFLQEFAGYCLTTDTSLEKAIWLVGPPGGGKSTLLEGFIAMLGERAGVLGLAEIEKSPFAVAKLIGKTLVTAAEQPAGFVSCHHVLNAIISGEMIQVERKYQNPYDIVPRAKIAWAMNETPRIPSGAEGLFRRVEVIKFTGISKSDRDPALKEGIKGEGAGILNWALEGLQRLRSRGNFAVPAKVEQDTEEFRQINDIPGLFVAERCLRDPEASEAASELYKEYKFWCEENGHRRLSSTRVAEDWQRLGFERYRSKGTTRYRGVRVRLPGE